MHPIQDGLNQQPRREEIWGEFLILAWRILGKITGEWRFFSANFSGLFFQGFRAPKKCTPKIHVQNLSAFLSNVTSRTQFFSRRFSAHGGDQNQSELHAPNGTRRKLPAVFLQFFTGFCCYSLFPRKFQSLGSAVFRCFLQLFAFSTASH